MTDDKGSQIDCSGKRIVNARGWTSNTQESDPTVRLTSADYPVPENQEFCFAPSKTIVGLVKKIRCLTCSIV